MSLERTLVILKPSAVQRGLIGEITSRFERKGLRLVGMKMMQLTDDILNEHYAHLSERPFFQRVKSYFIQFITNQLPETGRIMPWLRLFAFAGRMVV